MRGVAGPFLRLFTAILFAMAATMVASAQAPQGQNPSPSAPTIGALTIQLADYHPMAEYPETIRRILGGAAGQQVVDEFAGRTGAARHSVDLRQESFHLYVPPHYDGNTPFGLIIYISPQEDGTPPKSFLRGLDAQNFILVSAHGAGNAADVLARRIPLALHAAQNIRSGYRIDPARIYVAGISGGAKVAAFLGVAYADVFAGSLMIVGSEPIAAGKIILPDGELGAKVLAERRYVFLTGDGDFNREDIRRDVGSFRKAGVAQVKLIDVRGMGHSAPTAKTFERALADLTGDGSKAD
jgi:predicted esterase